MGREVRRVALDFIWPINVVWKGFMNPYSPTQCKSCGGSGEGPELRKLSNAWYDFDGTGARWCDKINDEEVDALWEKGRLQPYFKAKPTAEAVNEWERNRRGFGHDAINRWICVETRANRLGINEPCSVCEGHGHYWCEDKYEDLYQEWERIPPPPGPGYQLWETTSEGSPMSPVFETPKELARWLTDNGASTFGHSTTTYENWLAFVSQEDAWALTMVSNGRELKSGVDAVAEGTR